MALEKELLVLANNMPSDTQQFGMGFRRADKIHLLKKTLKKKNPLSGASASYEKTVDMYS